MSVIIRAASNDDAISTRNVAVTCGIDAWTIDQYRHEAGRSDTVFLAAMDGPEMKGFISGRIVPSTIEGEDGEIYNIAVLPQFRESGIGRCLLENTIDKFNSAGCRAIWLEVRASNINALQFYESRGFRRSTTRRNFYSDPIEDAVVMKLTLEGSTGENAN